MHFVNYSFFGGFFVKQSLNVQLCWFGLGVVDWNTNLQVVVVHLEYWEFSAVDDVWF